MFYSIICLHSVSFPLQWINYCSTAFLYLITTAWRRMREWR
jgi:hypothetical protein